MTTSPPIPTDLATLLPGDDSRQRDALGLAREWIARRQREGAAVGDLLDLGCGDGGTAKTLGPLVGRWAGVDIADSGEVLARPADAAADARIASYDGLVLPYPAASFDIVYSRQVFEHVRHPEAVLREIERVLRPGGLFVGSTSSLEPYHSRSYWSYTPWGFACLCHDAGLAPCELRPGIDAPTLMLRSMLRGIGLMRRLFDRWFERESPFNRVLELTGRLRGVPVARRNRRKLQWCGHVCFAAAKRAE